MPAPVVLGLDFGGTKIAVAVAELTGIRLGERTILTRPTEGAVTTLRRGLSCAHELLADVAPGRELLAVGAGTFGIPSDDRVELAPTIPGWEALAFGRELRDAFGDVEIRLATDVKAAALAELEFGELAGCDPGIYLNLGTGLAAAIVANGVVLQGSHGASGEIGYNLRTAADVGLTLEARAPLEHAISGQALARAVVDGQVGHANGNYGLTGSNAVSGGEVTTVPDGFVTELCFHLVNLAIAIDPQRIVVGGGIVRSWSQFEARLRGALQAAVPFAPELVRSAFPYDAPLIGALAMATAAAKRGALAGGPT